MCAYFCAIMPPSFENMSREDVVLKAHEYWYQLEELKRLVFGAKSERHVADAPPAEQLALFGDGPAPAAAVTEKETITYERGKPKAVKTPHGRGFIPPHLERVDILLEPEEDVTGMTKIGEEVTEELEYAPGKLYVKRYIRPRYALPGGGGGVLVAPAPERPLPKAMAGTGLLAHLLVSKYVDHLPFHRQIAMFARGGVKLPSSTVGAWNACSADLLVPLFAHMTGMALSSNYLQADETTIQVLDEGKKGKSHRGYYWACLAVVERLVVFRYDKGRSGAAARKLLAGFKGALQTDHYAAYEQFAADPLVSLFACWAHARRKFHEALTNDRAGAETMLGAIRWLYAVEERAREKGLSPDGRKALRMEYSLPMLEIIKRWLDEKCYATTPSSPIGKAVNYALRLWPRLTAYINDGRVEIDNNLVENKIRPIALGRKNYLFAGSHEAAERAAMVYSFMATCSLNGVNPQEWLEDVLNRIQSHTINRIGELLPAQWKLLREQRGDDA